MNILEAQKLCGKIAEQGKNPGVLGHLFYNAIEKKLVSTDGSRLIQVHSIDLPAFQGSQLINKNTLQPEDGTLPKYEQLIPRKETLIKFEIDTSILNNIMLIMEAVSNKNCRIKNKPCLLSFENGKVIFDRVSGVVNPKIVLESNYNSALEGYKIGFNVQLIKEALEYCVKNKIGIVYLEFPNEDYVRTNDRADELKTILSPFTLTCDEFDLLVMPMSVNIKE